METAWFEGKKNMSKVWILSPWALDERIVDAVIDIHGKDANIQYKKTPSNFKLLDFVQSHPGDEFYVTGHVEQYQEIKDADFAFNYFGLKANTQKIAIIHYDGSKHRIVK